MKNAVQHMLRAVGFPLAKPAFMRGDRRWTAEFAGAEVPSKPDCMDTLRQALVAVRQENIRLEAESRARTRLFAAAVHDLRQPLQALMLYSDAIAEDEQTCQHAHAMAQVRHSVESLERLFNGLLDLTQINAGALQPKCRDLALAPLLNEVQRNFHAIARSRGLRLIVRSSTASVHADGVMLTRILNNLVCNALCNTAQGGVLVGVRQHPRDVRVDVCDTGIGIAPQHQLHVFEEFYRVSPAGSGTLGHGLGLATVRHLAELQGARIRLCSRPGRGTTVSLHLRRGCAAETGAQANQQ